MNEGEHEGLGQYTKRLEEARNVGRGEFPNFARRTPAPSARIDVVEKQESVEKVEQTLAELAQELHRPCPRTDPLPKSIRGKFQVVDGRTSPLCHHCKLPLGEMAYASEDGPSKNSERLMHGECMAQRMLADLRSEEKERKREETALKQSRRAEFDIGWSPEAIPRNAAAARKLACEKVPQGMCCLVSGQDRSIKVVPTFEPAAAMNLEYLSTALQVRRTEGREPLFSLDPVDNGKVDEEEPDASMQVKRFEPEWLAGTSVGEVMFQADYHLKELSFGEYEQPVVGMKSCFEYSEKDGDDCEWSAREWFVVRKAEIHVSDDQVLIPHLKMGVEAREQLMGDDGLEDAALTRPDHPLVKYADAFTHNFDLIAERKSVVSQLRDVAKASIMAKYLLESGSVLEETWFNLASEPSPMCCLEVPQLWNDRCFSKISVKDGLIDTGKCPKMHGLYGGVDFGIDRFRLSAPSRVATSVVASRAVLGRPASSLMATTRTGLTLAPARQFARLSAPLSASMSMAASRAGLGVPRVAAGLSMGVPQGVDLNLDSFNLSAPTEAGGRWGGNVQAQDAESLVGGTFFDKLDGCMFSSDDRSLFKDLYNPYLSDRRSDGDKFSPPASNVSYMQKLAQLVKAESVVSRQRKEHFLSDKFSTEHPGPLFPSSWTSSIEISCEQKVSSLRPRPDFVAEAGVLKDTLARLVPVFDKRTENGARFAIYRIGALEVRTTQEHDGEELVGMVFSILAPQ